MKGNIETNIGVNQESTEVPKKVDTPLDIERRKSQGEEALRAEKAAQTKAISDSIARLSIFKAKNSRIFSTQNDYAVTAQQVESRLKGNIDRKESIEDLTIDVYDLYQKFKFRLGAPNLDDQITVSDEILTRLAPDNAQLQKIIKESLKPTSDVREVLVVSIFETIIWNENQEINKQASVLFDGEIDEDQPQRKEKIIGVLNNFNLRENHEDQSESLTANDLISLNARLNTIDDPQEREELLDSFVGSLSEASGLSVEEVHTRIAYLTGRIQGVETLRLTFDNLKTEGRATALLRDDGRFDEELFTEYYSQASESVRSDYQAFDEILIKKLPKETKELTPQVEPQPELIELTSVEALSHPIISALAKRNPFIAEDFLNDSSTIRFTKTPEGEPAIELVYDKGNVEHGVSVKFEEKTGRAAVLIGGKEVMDTSVTDPYELRRNLNAASANHLLFEQLKIPASVFPDEKVDSKGLEGRNDPAQLIQMALGLPEGKVINGNKDMIGDLDRLFTLTLGDDYSEAPTAGIVEEVLERSNWLDAHGKLRTDVNKFLGTSHELLSRNSSIDTHEEFWDMVRNREELRKN